MVLPTKVNIINDYRETIKVKIDNDRDYRFDKIINIKPGSRLDGIEGSVSGSGKFDVIIDIIINPAGPDNNTRLGGFQFNNPFIGLPYVRSDDFKTLAQDDRTQFHYLTDVAFRRYGFTPGKGHRDPEPRKHYWGDLDKNLIDNSQFRSKYSAQIAVLINSAPVPTFTTDPFFDDDAAGAKVWDFRINSYDFRL